MPDSLRHTLIRVYDMAMRRCHGNVVVDEILFRRIEVNMHGYRGSYPGAVLIDNTGALQVLMDMTAQNIGFLVFIRATDEVLWVCTTAHLTVGDQITVEMVPWVEHLRNISAPDDDVIRKAHQNP